MSDSRYVVWRADERLPWRVHTFVSDGGTPRPANDLEVDGADDHADTVDDLFDALAAGDGTRVVTRATVVREALGWDVA